jgi:hypothetical protein
LASSAADKAAGSAGAATAAAFSARRAASAASHCSCKQEKTKRHNQQQQQQQQHDQQKKKKKKKKNVSSCLVCRLGQAKGDHVGLKCEFVALLSDQISVHVAEVRCSSAVVLLNRHHRLRQTGAVCAR